MKKCPYCRTVNEDGATVCRYCSSTLSGEEKANRQKPDIEVNDLLSFIKCREADNTLVKNHSFEDEIPSLAQLFEQIKETVNAGGTDVDEEILRLLVSAMAAGRMIEFGDKGLLDGFTALLNGCFSPLNTDLFKPEIEYANLSVLLGRWVDDGRGKKCFEDTAFLKCLYIASGVTVPVVIAAENLHNVKYFLPKFLEYYSENPYMIRVLPLSNLNALSSPPALLTRKTMNMPSNIWFAYCASEAEPAPFGDECFIPYMENGVREPLASAASEKIKCSAEHFERLCTRAREQYYLSEKVWRQFDKAESLTAKEQKGFRFNNRFIRSAERFSSAYLACGGDEAQAAAAIINVYLKPLLRKSVNEKSEQIIQSAFDKGILSAAAKGE